MEITFNGLQLPHILLQKLVRQENIDLIEPLANFEKWRPRKEDAIFGFPTETTHIQRCASRLVNPIQFRSKIFRSRKPRYGATILEHSGNSGCAKPPPSFKVGQLITEDYVLKKRASPERAALGHNRCYHSPPFIYFAPNLKSWRRRSGRPQHEGETLPVEQTRSPKRITAASLPR